MKASVLVLALAACGDPALVSPDAAPISCGAVVTLAQPSTDLCAPHVARADNAGKRECLYDVDDAGDPDDGDRDTCVTPLAVYDEGDISGMTVASGAAERLWVINDAGSKTRRRCDGPCVGDDVDVPDPVSGHDCNAGSRELRNGKWLFLLGRGAGGALAKLGQVMVVGHRTGETELDMLDPEGITRFEMKGRSYLVIVDGGLKGGSVDECRPRGLCLPLSLGARCAVDAAAAPTCAARDTEEACAEGADCAWLHEPGDFAVSREGRRHALAIIPEPDADAVERRGPDAYDSVCVQADNGDPAPGSWVYFTLPTSGCGDATTPCPPEAMVVPSTLGLFDLEGVAAVPDRDGVTLLLFAKALRLKVPLGQCAEGVFRDGVRIDGGIVHVFALDHLERFQPGRVHGLAAGTEAHTRLVARVDLGARQGSAVASGLRVTQADYAADPARAGRGWLLFGSRSVLLGGAWDAATGVLDDAFFDGMSRLTQVEEANADLDCAGACLPEQESLAARLLDGGLRTYHAGETARKRDTSGRQHPAPLVTLDHCGLVDGL